MKSSLIRSILGVLFCWVPLIGLIFGLTGFIGACRRVTARHKAALVLLTVFTVIVLALDVGVLTWETYAYTRSPKIVSMTGDTVWKLLTGAQDKDESLSETVEAWKHPETLIDKAADASADDSGDDYEFTPDGVDYDEAGGSGLGQDEEQPVPGVLLPNEGDNAVIVPPDNAGGDTVVIEAGSEKTGIPEGLPSVSEIMSGTTK